MHAQTEQADEVRRLHPSSLLFRLGASIRSLLLPLILLVFFSGKSESFAWIAWPVGASMAYVTLQYFTHRYRFCGDELVVSGGMFFRFERHIPYERVQNIDVTQSLFHRLFRVADVKVETASGATAEAHLQVLSLSAIEEMRQRVFAQSVQPNTTAPQAEHGGMHSETYDPLGSSVRGPQTLLRLRPRELLLFGLMSNRGMAVILGALGLAYEFDVLDQANIKRIGNWGSQAAPGLSTLLESQAFIAVAFGAGLGVLLLLMRLLSVGWAFGALYDFTLLVEGEDLRTECGLFTRYSATIPRRRIQAVTVQESWLNRIAGYVSVKVDTAGGSLLEESAATRRWVAPLVARDELPGLLEALQPGVTRASGPWSTVHARTAYRLSRKRCVLILAASSLSAWWWTPAVLWGVVPVCLFAVWDARRRAAAFGHCQVGGFFSARRGVWTRTTRMLPCSRVQVLVESESPFDRRWGTRTVGLDIAGTGETTRVPFLSVDTARQLAAELNPLMNDSQIPDVARDVAPGADLVDGPSEGVDLS